jgi:hypothetical protein
MANTSDQAASVAVIVRLEHAPPASMTPEAAAKIVPKILQPTLETIEGIEGISRVHPFRLQPTFSAEVTPEGLKKLLSLGGILSVETDDRWPLHTAEGMALIGADVLQTYGFSGAGWAVAIIDTGIDALHPALGGGEIPNPKVVLGLDTADGDDDPSDCSGHGTAVASIAAGVSVQWSPGRYFAGGVAPEAKILAYKAASDDDCLAMRESAVIAAIEDAILHRDGDDYSLAAINISGGGGAWTGPCDTDNPALSAAVDAATSAGITVVASAGNEGLSESINSPACIENVLAVGSVWDQNPSPTGSLFCLNATCTKFCDDQHKAVGQPVCYSNSGPMLDLLAPSEYLRVAEAGGRTTAFGGTSGAAPYVTGGIAILKRAHPYAPPAHMRAFLVASEMLITDPKNHRTLPLTDLVTAIHPPGLVLGEALATDLWPEESGPLTSFAMVDSQGPVGGILLTLRITHPHPTSLKVRLRSPGGTSILVSDGTTPNPLENGLIGTFPFDLKPVQSFNAFIGEERNGAWELSVEDLMSEPHQAQIEMWSLQIEDLNPPSVGRSPQMTFLPVAARGPGAAGTQWTTDLQLFNPSVSTPLRGSLFLIQEEVNGIEDSLRRPLFIPAGAQISLTDIVGDTFDLSAGAGQVLIDSSSMPLIAGGTVATRATSGGAFGQFEHGISSSTERRLVLPHISGGPNFRTNIGFSETGGTPAAATVTLRDTGTGQILAPPMNIEVQPFSIRRIDGILQAVGAPSTTEAYAVVETESALSAWASVVDQGTGDAVFVMGAEPINEGPIMIPVVASTSGTAGTHWRSDVRIVASGDDQAELELELRPLDTQNAPPLTATISLDPETAAVLTNIVGDLFGLTETAGSLRIIPGPGTPPLSIASRTYNVSDEGTFGQYIPAVTGGCRDRATLIGIQGSPEQRSNLLVNEVLGEAIEIQTTLRDEHGDLLGTPVSLTIEAFGLIQVNDVFSAFGVMPRRNCRIDLERVGGQGSFFALASVVDRQTGDAVAIPMTEIN